MAHFVGKWKHERSENFEQLLVAQGTPWLVRKMMVSTSPIAEFSIAEDGTWTIKLVVAVKTKVVKFKIDEVYEDTVGMSGTAKKFIARLLEGGKQVTQLAENPDEGMIITREVVDEQMVMTMQYKDVVARRYFKKTT